MEHDHLRDAGAAADAYRMANEQLDQARARLLEHVEAARAAGVSWKDIEASTGIRTRILQGLIERTTASYQRRESERTAERQKAIKPRKTTYADPYPGMSVAAAAAALGVSTVTVYEWERTGRLQGYKDPVETAGKLRIVGGEGLQPSQV